MAGTAQSFDDLICRAFTQPPHNDGDPNGYYAHQYLARHAGFKGRPYRRGNNRCKHCGAVMSAPDGTPDKDRFLSLSQRITQNIMRPNAMLKYMTRKTA